MIQAKAIIRHWKDMEKYGFNLLTGEACGLSYRGLTDLTEQGLEIVQRTIGAVELKAPTNYNSGAVASLLLPYSMLEPLAVFALFMRENCQHVVIQWGADTYSGIRLSAYTSDVTREELGQELERLGVERYRVLTYPEQRPGVTQGMSNVHQMTGRQS